MEQFPALRFIQLSFSRQKLETVAIIYDQLYVYCRHIHYTVIIVFGVIIRLNRSADLLATFIIPAHS